jgi:ABC-type phosphate transport system ATPase subunit
MTLSLVNQKEYEQHNQLWSNLRRLPSHQQELKLGYLQRLCLKQSFAINPNIGQALGE